MELQFDKTGISCLQQVKWENQTQELTQEIRLTEDMPDIGCVLGAWGQPLIRSKQWRSGCIEVSGGVMAFALYIPEDGSAPRNLQAWMPFNMRWDMPETKHDGTISVQCMLSGVDARSASARKLIVRAGVGVQAEALAPQERELCTPAQMPADVQVLQRTYPVQLPTEAGEKAFTMEETVNVPGSSPAFSKMVRFALQPEVIDRKVMGDKVVFRGSAITHMLYLGEDGCLYSWDFEVPFSQYAQLDQEHDSSAKARVIPALTGLELEPDAEGQLHLKAGLTCQYIIYDCKMLQIVEDAYSNVRSVTPAQEQLELPVLLDTDSQLITAEQSFGVQGTRVADGVFYPEQPRLMREGDRVQLCLSGVMQMLYYDLEGNLQCETARWEDSRTLLSSPDTQSQADLSMTGKLQANITGAGGELRSDLVLNTRTQNSQGLCQVCGAELGEVTQPDPNRPSLILRAAGDKGLWELAKLCGSTVEAIRKANALEGEPDGRQLLLIPVL